LCAQDGAFPRFPFCDSIFSIPDGRLVNFVRKMLLFFALALSLLLAISCACAAEIEYPLTICNGKVAISDQYVVLTPENLSEHPDLLSYIGKTVEEMTEDWAERGVMLQAWTTKRDGCIEISAYVDDDSRTYYDLEQQTRQTRNEYRLAHIGNSKYTEQGYAFHDVEWKKQKLGGNFLKMTYKRTVGDTVYQGCMRKTVRNGYTVVLDFQVYNRAIRSSDELTLNKIANTVEFYKGDVQDVAAVSSDSPTGGFLQVTVGPPLETDSDTFTVEGRCTPGARLIGVLMYINSSSPVKYYADAGKSGSFKMKVTLPEERVWLMTLNVEVDDKIVAEEIFNTTTYSKTLIPVTMDSEFPDQLSGDEQILSGTTINGVTVQCIAVNGSNTFDKTIRTNGTGRFTFKVPTDLESDYDFTLVFSKKNHDTRRLQFSAKRHLTTEDIQRQTKAKATRPGYAQLVKKLDTYIRQPIWFQTYITDIQQNGDEWIITSALKRSGESYSDFLVWISDTEPSFEVGSRPRLYGTCIGPYQIQSEEGTVSYPSFDLVLVEQ